MKIWIVRQDLSCYVFTIQRIWIVLGRCLFLRYVHTFSWFLKSNWSSDFGHAETGNGAKKRVVLGREFFCSNFKVEWENGVWTRIRFLGSGFCSHAAISLWFLLFFRFFVSDFFLNGSPNPFIVHSRLSFLLESNFLFSLVIFCSR